MVGLDGQVCLDEFGRLGSFRSLDFVRLGLQYLESIKFSRVQLIRLI